MLLLTNLRSPSCLAILFLTVSSIDYNQFQSIDLALESSLEIYTKEQTINMDT